MCSSCKLESKKNNRTVTKIFKYLVFIFAFLFITIVSKQQNVLAETPPRLLMGEKRMLIIEKRMLYLK